PSGYAEHEHEPDREPDRRVGALAGEHRIRLLTYVAKEAPVGRVTDEADNHDSSGPHENRRDLRREATFSKQVHDDPPIHTSTRLRMDQLDRATAAAAETNVGSGSTWRGATARQQESRPLAAHPAAAIVPSVRGVPEH